jgi:hypothetical protein
MDEEEKAQREADEYFKSLHPDNGAAKSDEESGNTIYSSVAKNASGENEKEIKDKEDKANKAALYGAGAGAYAAHTDAFRRTVGKLIKPAPTVYAPSAPAAPRPSGKPSAGVRIEPSFGGAGAASEASQVDQMMQSIKGENKPTGRQMERGHNWETNRESLATKQNLKTPGAPQAIVEAGPMAPTRGGIAVPESVAREMEEEALRKEAARRVAEQNAKAAADARAAQEAELAAQAEAKAAQKAATKSKVIGYGKGALKVGSGALGGALAAKDIYELSNKPRSEWTDEDYGKAVSAAGGLSMTVPTPITQLGGLALTGAGMAYPHVAPHVRRFMGNK